MYIVNFLSIDRSCQNTPSYRVFVSSYFQHPPSVQLLQPPHPIPLPLRNQHPHQTLPQHPLPINPRMHLKEQLRPIPPRRPHQLPLPARMKR